MRRSILRCLGLDPVCLYFAGRVPTTSEALVVGFLVAQVFNLALASVMDCASTRSKEVA
ncbi:hypothetical protein QZM66_23160 [Burkholderia contaminans]|uniref:hypothetical protein n=1 Tax=Burkholderia contaminans TaxID=488447 RepID=UPI00264C2A07|nr:hypothetical protein [Burkholderia contaminans]MDN7790468.1 hypothetical protein [Burkholderia contaminans]